MAQKNVRKVYLPASFYHIYNRGVEKRPIFTTQADMDIFEYYLSCAVNKENMRIYEKALMPNHYHILIFQNDSMSITRAMHSVGLRYTMFFNLKYNRVGHLFQGPYRARLVNSQRDFESVSAYIKNHNNSEFETWSDQVLW